MAIKIGIILVLVAISALIYLYHATHDFAWLMLHLVIAGLFVSFALTFTTIVLLIRLLGRLEDLITKLNKLLPGNIFIRCIAFMFIMYRFYCLFLESDQELTKLIDTNVSTSKKVTFSEISTLSSLL